jgi:serine/threonine protein kinase
MKNKFKTSCSRFLTWDQRLHICLDVAMGLQYIHEYRQPSYVHKDITSSNILLNAELKAKITNFNMGTKHKISRTPGYMAPEYPSHGLVTTKTDVYAFGIVLLEILSGQTLIIMKGTKVLLAETIGPLSEASNPTEELKGWMDPSLHQVYSIDLL